jgi:hypothetical protein
MLPANVDFIGRSRLDAALYAPPKQQRMGRPRVKGERLPSPQARGRSATGWTTITATVYDRRVKLKVKVFDALWYIVAGSRCLRFVLVRGWPGHKHDDVLCSTDLTLTAEQIITRFALRWKIEVTFEETKGKLGFEDPQNRTDLAVARTAPFALWVYTLIIVWYVTQAKHLKYVRLPAVPWYTKSVPAFSDMLAAIRREIWGRRLLDPAASPQTQQKYMEDLVLQVGYAA